MFRSLKFKFVVAISFLVIFLLVITSAILIDDKVKEISRDIYVNAKSFSKLATKDVVKNYEELLEEGGFYLFAAHVQSLFDDNRDVKHIQLLTFEGKMLYDSLIEKDEIYRGEDRIILDQNLIDRIRAKNISVLTEDDRIIYIKTIDFAEYTVDKNEKFVPDIADGEKIVSIVVPFEGEYAVIFGIDYTSLADRIAHTRNRIILLAIFGILLGTAVGYIFADTITSPIARLKVAVGIIAKGDFKARVQIKSRDEVGALADSVNSMAKDLEISTKALVYKERVAKELELATELQKNILPKTVPIVPGIDISSALMPAAEVGGDLYDFIVPSENELLSYIGDVTGHGVSAGILGSVANALIFGFHDKFNIQELLTNVNSILAAKTAQNMFLTLVLTHWNNLNKTFSYVSAGHEQIVYYSKKNHEVTLLPKGGLALGMIPDVSTLLFVQTVKPEPGDIAVLYSDGVPEAWRSETEMYGMERFKKALLHFSDLQTARAIKNAMLTDLKQFMGDYSQMDDITLVLYKWT